MRNLHFEKAGLLGSIFALLCCLGFGPLLAALSAIGAGFLVNDRILAPPLVVFLALGAVGLSLSLRQHHRWAALIAHIISGAAVFLFTFIAYNRTLIWLGIAGLIAAVALDFFQRRRPARKAAIGAT
jgi:hypothetical protein